MDLKISLARYETMSVYRVILKTAAASGGIPLAASSNRMAAIIQICRSVLTCFGLPSVSADTLLQICKANLLDDLGNNVSVLLAEGVAALSMGATVLSGGMPFFLIPMAVNVAAVVPATTRLFLMLACDLILVLTRAFQEAAAKCVGQPLKRDVEMAAVAYGQRYCREVHDRVRRLVPRLKVLRSFRTDAIAAGVAEIVQEYKSKVVQDVGAVPAASAPSSYGRARYSAGSASKFSVVSEEGSEATDCEKEDILKAAEWIRTGRA